MFHFPALPPQRLYIHRRVTRHHSRRVSPFGHPRIHARLTAPRGISQPPTSFIGSQCQGIHHAPLNTYNTKPKNELKNCITPQTQARAKPPPQRQKSHPLEFARCSQPLSTNQTPHPTTKAGQQHASHHTQWPEKNGPVVSKPNSVPGSPSPQIENSIPLRLNVCRAPNPRPLQTQDSSRLAFPQWKRISWCSLERR
jgi:hypothetical protein